MELSISLGVSGLSINNFLKVWNEKGPVWCVDEGLTAELEAVSHGGRAFHNLAKPLGFHYAFGTGDALYVFFYQAHIGRRRKQNNDIISANFNLEAMGVSGMPRILDGQGLLGIEPGVE